MSGVPFVPTAAEMAEAFGGVLVAGAAATALPAVSIDTRTLEPGALFVALIGPSFDGHAFVADAVARGARGIVVSDVRAAAGLPEALPVIRVDDTLRGMQHAARVVRRRSGTRVVAITGSAGKTTTKEITAALLSTHVTTFRTQGNLNNHIGLPLSLFQLRTCPAMAVVELGMSGAGEVRRLVEIAEPDVRVWLNVGSAHLGHFASIESIADAKAEILEHAGRDDLLVANAADPLVMQRVAGFVGRTVTFGVNVGADVAVRAVSALGPDGMRATLVAGRDAAPFETPLLGEGNLANIAAAAAVALDAGVPFDTVVRTVPTIGPAPHRGQVVQAPGGWTVIDDAYNSSPEALQRALAAVGASSARRVVLLGEMLELGGSSARLHADCGRAVAAVAPDVLAVVGGDAAEALAAGAIEAGFDPARVTHDASSDTLAARVRSLVRPGDVVLVKGSRGIAMDRVVAALLEEES